MLTVVASLDEKGKQELDDWYLLSLCVWREARNQPYTGKLGVAYTVINRADHPSWWGSSIHAIILKPFQYSSFNKDDHNSLLFPESSDLSWIESKDAAMKALCRIVKDPTDGATHYYANYIAPPPWVATAEFKIQIGTHIFLKTT